MSRKFISAILAAAVGLTAFGATPARAEPADVARALAAIATVAIIAKALDNSGKRQDKVVISRSGPPAQARPNHQPTRAQPHARAGQHGHIKPRPLPQRAQRMVLPAQCLQTLRTRHGTQQVFGRSCLRDSYSHARQLPTRCEATLRGRDRDRRVYDAQCLRNAGYTVARR